MELPERRTYKMERNLNTKRSIAKEIAFGSLFTAGQTMSGIGLVKIILGLTIFSDHSSSVPVVIAGAVCLLIGVCCFVAHYAKKQRAK